MPKKLQSVYKTYWMAVVCCLVMLAVSSIPVHAFGFRKKQYDFYFPVKLSEASQSTYQIFGRLCWRGDLNSRRSVQLLVHGGTYDHHYWDFPLYPFLYSYVDQATAVGFATLAIDRIGVGLSDKPPADQVTFQSNAYVSHQIVQALRSGEILGAMFEKVVAVGHSMGAGISIIETAMYHDVDGVVVSGMAHDLNPDAIADMTDGTYPAQLDPKFMDADLPEGYMTTGSEIRSEFYYNHEIAQPQVIIKDEMLKQTITVGELNTMFDMLNRNLSNQIDVPVLLVMGQNDRINCNEDMGLSCANAAELIAREQDAYSPETELEAYIQYIAGHCTNLHLNARIGYYFILDWMHRHNLQ